MTEILLIRHGETDWNVERRLQGHLDIGLNVTGMRQAAALEKALQGVRIDAVIASDLERAIRTAEQIAMPRGMKVQTDSSLRERCYGALEGLRYSDISARYPEAYAMWQSRDPDARYPSGVREAETLREFAERAVGAVTRLAGGHSGKRIVVVTHGGVLDCLYRAAKNMSFTPPRNFEIRNAGINRLLWDGAALHIKSWCEVDHLADLALDEIDEQYARKICGKRHA
jgi:2,3-bisphosphoglycerate-dependent phosphoglycerate mutase